MARDEALPFERGTTFYGKGNTPNIARFGEGGVNLEGKEFWAESQNRPLGTRTDTSGRKVRVRAVRNRSGIALLPKRIVRAALGAANESKTLTTGTDGYVFAVTDPILGVVDELLPPSGVPDGDLFWVVVEGPTQVITATTGSISIAAGAYIAVATGTSQTSADAGFVTAMNTSSTTVAQLLTKVGRAEANLPATVVTTSATFAAVVNIHSF